MLVPWLQLKATAKAVEFKDKLTNSPKVSDSEADPDEHKFIQKVEEEYRRPVYNDYEDYAEMVVQV